MNQSQEQYAELRLLICQSEEGSISLEGMQKLNDILLNDSEARKYYQEYIHTNVILKSLYTAEQLSFQESKEYKSEQDYKDLFIKLAEYEKTAQTIEILKEKPGKEVVQKVVYPMQEKRRVSKFNIIFLALNAAAIVFILIFLKLAPGEPVEVATLSDSVNAKWADVDTSMEKGSRLSNSSEKLLLREGLAELTFDNYAKAVIEAPAEFQILADDRIGLIYGKVYATVPPTAVGFSVYTPSAKIVDLGTEFGVQSEVGGGTQLYVVKGKTSLIVGDESNSFSTEVTKNSAKRISGITHEVSDVPYDSGIFVRDINSKTNTVWHGEPIDLASIIGGGNGLLPVFEFQTLNPNTGCYETKPLVSIESLANSLYNPVLANPFIDGVFVPAGDNESLIVTSERHTISCPPNSGKFTYNIASFFRKYEASVSQKPQPAIFDGITYESQTNPSVLLHSNVGITIDLEQIRQAYSGLSIEQLQTGYGLTWAEPKGYADFLVFVDGVLEHEHKGLKSREPAWSLNLKLKPDARFLTFIVTDSQQQSQSSDVAHEYDFFYLLKPQLIVQ